PAVLNVVIGPFRKLGLVLNPTRHAVVVAVADVNDDRVVEQAVVVEVGGVAAEAGIARQRRARLAGEGQQTGAAALVLDIPGLIVAVAGLVDADVETTVLVDVLDRGDRRLDA